ncbi:MAG: phosphatidylglycerophosphatase A [Betaproteobacteria bacterium]|nr:phosphatidylglycerophosphatase A [Betaproteobacteria bacterium]
MIILANPTQANLKLLISHPACFFALGFGSGLAKKAPGTFGTLVGFPLYLLIAPLGVSIQFGLLALLFAFGIYCCDKTGEALGVADHGAIVWDEIVAMMLVLTVTPVQWSWWLAAFALFRLFDIWKPFPIRQCDQHIKGGLGVMLDDLLAAGYAMLCLEILQWLIAHYKF